MSQFARRALFFAATAFVAVTVAAPAPAETAKKTHRHKHVHRTEVAASAASTKYRGTDKFPAGPLYYNGGVYLGDDPDPNIRFQLWRDLGARFGGDE